MSMGKMRMGNGQYMANFFELDLDTTGPELSVYGPGYAMKSGLTDIEVRANEKLSNNAEFYFIDSNGKRHDVIFKYNGDSFMGEVDFSLFPDGISIFYGQVKDEVFNLSPVVTHSLLIHKGSGASVQVRDMNRFMIIDDHVRFIKMDDHERNVISEDYSRNLESKDSIRNIEVEIYE